MSFLSDNSSGSLEVSPSQQHLPSTQKFTISKESEDQFLSDMKPRGLLGAEFNLAIQEMMNPPTHFGKPALESIKHKHSPNQEREPGENRTRNALGHKYTDDTVSDSS